jgi:phage-related tail fiber protein
MPAALNNFRTVTSTVTDTIANVYTAPSGYSAVVLLAQVSNLTGSTITVSGNIYQITGNNVSLVQAAPLPANDAINLVGGRLILQTGDSFAVGANVNAASQLTVSVLETSTG